MSWKEENNYWVKTYEMKNFVACVEFLNQITELAEEANHHPDVEIFGYKHIKIKLMSHDVEKITDRDYDLAKKIDSLR